jgi:hypothetical protein
MTGNMAQRIRADWRPVSDMADLSAQAQRLEYALRVVEKWIVAADPQSGEAGHLWQYATTTRDQIEEELARIAHKMDVLFTQQLYRAGDHAEKLGDALEGVAAASELSDKLLEAYCLVRDMPEREFSERRTRYAMMGAPLAAQETAEAELPHPESSEASATAS